MSDRLTALKIFRRVARLGSFSRAARDFGLSQPSVSRIISELEGEIGAALVTRTTRAVMLTEVGLDYLARIEPLLDGLEEADCVARGTDELRGRLKIGLSSSFGVREVIPALPAFMSRHGGVHVDLAFDDQYQNLVVEGVDVAFRFGKLADSSATARLLDARPRLIVASTDYLSRAGRPIVPSDLTRHSVIVGPNARPPRTWAFHQQSRRASVRVDGRLTLSSNESAVAAAVIGLGIVSTVLWGCRAELEKGALIQVLDDWQTELVELHAVFPAGRAAKGSARAFVDHLAEHLAAVRRLA